MSGYLILDAGIEEDKVGSGAWSVWVSVKNPARGGSVNAQHRASLWGGEDEAAIAKLLIDSVPGSHGRLVEDAVRGFANDVVASFGERGAFVPPSGNDKLDAFMKRLSERVFRDCLTEHRVSDKMSYEQALLVLQEFYVVDPIMSS